MAEDWAEGKKASQKKRAENQEKSLRLLHDFAALNGLDIKQFSGSHFRIGEWDYWPSTGKFISQNGGGSGRGIFNLINKLKK